MNVVAFLLGLYGGDEFVTRWSVIPAQVALRSHWITILTAMFMHGSWSHILGNMVFDARTDRAADPTSEVPCLGASGAIAA
jgi:membrane associated rhomboid family serine protease